MTTARQQLLAAIRVAGYHDDQRTLVRLRVENRVSNDVWRQQWAAGQKMRADGMPCACPRCKTTTQPPPAP